MKLVCGLLNTFKLASCCTVILLGASCSSNAIPSTGPSSGDGSAANMDALPLKSPSALLVAAYPSLLAQHPEWQRLKLKEIDATWVQLSPVAGTTNVFERPDGRAIAFPQEDSASAPFASGTPNKFACGTGSYTASWTTVNGVATPPNCTSTGEFRRVFSTCCKSGMEAQILLPSSSTTVPHGPNQIDDITGFIYEEGWPGINTSDSEGGFQYSALNDNYNLYLRAPSFNEELVSPGVSSLATVSLQINALSAGQSTLPTSKTGSCSSGCIQGIYAVVGGNCPAGNLCASSQSMVAAGWIGNCCYVARMTTFARDTPYMFTGGSGGYSFGPAKWFGAYTHTLSGIDSVFAFGGTESYPNSKTYVSATSIQSDHSETDQVFLPPAITGSLR